MRNSLYQDFGDTLQRIHQIEFIAMENCVAHLNNTPYILPEIKQTSFLEADIQQLENICNVLESGTFQSLFDSVEERSYLGMGYANFLEACRDTSTKFQEAKGCLKNELAKVKECNDSEAAANFIKTLKDPSFASTLCCGKKEMEEVCFTTTGFKQITADDVENAKATIEGATEKIKGFKDRMKAKLDKNKETMSNMSKQMDDSAKKLSKVDKEACDKICDEAAVAACYIEMSDMIDHAECVALTNQILEEVKQSYTLLRMLQEHNARNIKDSKVVTEAVQDIAMCNFDSFIESVLLPLNEGKIGDKIRNMFDNVKSKMTASNTRFLKKYKDAALASKCDGIIVDPWYVEKDVHKTYEDTMKLIKKDLSPENMDLKDLKAKYKDLRGTFLLGYSDSKGTAISAKMLDGKSAAMVKNLAHKVERNHKVTPADVKFAVKFLSDSDYAIANMEQELQRACSVVVNTIYNPKTLLRTRGEAYVKKTNAYLQYVIDNVNLNYCKLCLSQLKVKQQQCRVVILKAARVSAKEAAEILGEELAVIESVFADFE